MNVLHIKDASDVPPAHWRTVYAFSEEEFFPTDFESSNFAFFRMPGGLFWDNIIAMKYFFLNDEEATDRSIETRHVGRFVIEGAVIRRHIGSHIDIIRTVTTEAERVDALQEFFGIHIPWESLKHIHGRASALCE